jgi:hypothetical protein
MKISSKRDKNMYAPVKVKTYDLSTRIIFVHSQTRVTTPLIHARSDIFY